MAAVGNIEQWAQARFSDMEWMMTVIWL